MTARERLIEAAGRGFRRGGYGGAGVDALAREAGLTSGAFYAQFGSKSEAFRLAVASGLQQLRGAVEHLRASEPASWRETFIGFYLGERMGVPLEEACALPIFASDVARSDAATREIYTVEYEALVVTLSDGLDSRPRALALLAILAGAAATARAVSNDTTRGELLAAAKAAALAI